MKVRSAAIAALTVMLPLVVVIAGPTVPAGADTATNLVLRTYNDLVVDDAHQQVFVSGAAAGTVEVRSFTGGLVATISGLPGAGGMVMSPDGSRLFVALGGGDAVAAIDPAIRAEVARWSTGSGTCPLHLAMAGGKLWVGYGCSDSEGAVASMDPAAATPVLGEPLLSTHYEVPPVTGRGSTLYTLGKAFHVTPQGVTMLGSLPGHNPCWELPSIVTDETHVIDPCENAEDTPVFRLSDMVVDGGYPDLFDINGPMNGAAAATEAGVVAIAGNVGDGQAAGHARVGVWAEGTTTPLRRMDWVGYAGKVALTHDAARMFVITHTGSVPDTGPVVLHIVPNPTLPQLTATLSVTTNLTTYAYGATAIVTARLGATHDSRLLTIYATPYRGVKRRIASGNADATGRLVAKVIVQGTTTITARFEGDDRYRASAATARVTSPAKIVAKLSRNYGRSGHVHLYRPAKNPLLSVHVRPEAAGVCIGYRLQRKYGGSWHMLARPNCFSLDVHGRHAVVINGTHVVGSLYRVRARLRKSGYTPETAFGHWKYFRYRHR